MIVIKILGGLGNQLFQYAAGYALAKKLQTELKLDVTGFADYELRNFDLEKINIPISIASHEEIEDLKALTTAQRIGQKLKPYPKKRFYKEPFFHYDPAFFDLGADVYLQGYFQSEKYFFEIEDKIRSVYNLERGVSSNIIKEFGVELRNKNSVAIHIRKGDYKNKAGLQVHGVVPMSYYNNAINQIRSAVSECKFYLFSDDSDTARKELIDNSVNLISGHITQNHFEDLYLMSQCRHNIIANSSFSWWAAWLNSNPDKIVITPKKWFKNGPKDTQDLVPESWIRL